MAQHDAEGHIRQRRVSAGGYEAVVHEAGDAAADGRPPVVLLASMFVRARTYRPLLEILGRHFRTIVVEAPGTGEASQVEQPWSFERYASWLAEFLAALDLTDVTLIGHSNSGPPVFLAAAAAAAAAAADPVERIGRIVLADSTGIDRRHSFLRVVIGRLMDAPMEPIFSLRVAPDIAHSVATRRRHVIHQIKLAHQTDLVPLVDRVRVPTLLAWGRWDFTYPLRYARRLHERMPEWHLHVSQRGSHDWLVARRTEFAEVVRRFVADTSTVAAPTADTPAADTPAADTLAAGTPAAGSPPSAGAVSSRPA
ncbi:MAG TPA: alpha/beta hydrolase [Tepidisphaeraceae bacterium]|nr:alpha/beta hydrolase [Tepidisphaeraceae bacterium]